MQNATGGDLVLGFDGGGLLRVVRRASNGYVYLEQRTGGVSPWRLELRDRAGQTRTVTAFDAHACHVECVGTGLRLTWREISNASDVVVHASFASVSRHPLRL
jgi:hypothetical protein